MGSDAPVSDHRVIALRERVLRVVPEVPAESRWYRAVKRSGDVVLASLLLLLFSPLFLLVALAVALDSRGPVFFRQERLGRHGEPFSMLKFRSMRTDENSEEEHRAYVTAMIEGSAEPVTNGEGEQVFKLVGDDRVTRVGRVIRRLSIDELPQLFNVLRGQMSLVGPRPPLWYEVERYRGPHFTRMTVTPGVTGLWQVSGRNSLGFEEMVALDIEYVERRSVRLDLKILIRTIPAVFSRSGA